MRARIAISGADAQAARVLLRQAGYTVVDGSDGAVDLTVVDEWTAESARVVSHARATGSRVTVLAEMLLEAAPGRVVAVTGTAGKTSTCRVLEAILRFARVPVLISSTARSGNAWPDHSVADGLASASPDAVLVAELTSTHLCHMSEVHPDVAVVTTIRPDHVELHGTLDDYHRAKRRLVADLTDRDQLILPTDDPHTLAVLGPVRGHRWGFGTAPAPRGAISANGSVVLTAAGDEASCRTELDGPLLRAALAGSAAALALGIAPDQVAAALADIHPVMHRQAPREGPRGITIIDDSMAGTPVKALAAIHQFAGSDLVVVLGGDDRLPGAPVHAAPEEEAALREATAAARKAAGTIVAFGPASARIRDYMEPDAGAEDLAGALALAVAACPDGGTVLVSPMFPMSPEDRERVAGTR